MTNAGRSSGRIVTFYSYKGGTGRTMALANVAWILASNGKRVLAIDWDLEAPGLHRYFHPFLFDKDLWSSRGVIDLVTEQARANLTGSGGSPAIDRFITALDWAAFPAGGRIDFMPAGQQDSAYASAVGSFDWLSFYENRDGEMFFERLREELRSMYDYVLIDSRTGLNDVAGICTIALPDTVVACFTMSTQSIEGAVAVAASIQAQRPADPVEILPVPMRVEYNEHIMLEAGRDYARSRFAPFLTDRASAEVDRYWGTVEVPYRPFFAYEEILAVFGERPNQENSLLAPLEYLVESLTGGEVRALRPMPEPLRRRSLGRFLRARPATDHDVMISYVSIDRMWAEWMAAELADAGVAARLQAIDFTTGSTGLMEIQKVAGSADRVLIVLSRHYVRAPLADDLWTSCAAMDPDGSGQRVVPVRIDATRLPVPFTDRPPVDLSNSTEVRARTLLRDALGVLEPASSHVDGLEAGVRRPRYPADRPPVWRVPPRSGFFVGRSTELEELRERLASTTMTTPHALFGLGGVGKTRLAIEYAHRFAADYDLVWWVSAETIGTARADLTALAERLELVSGPDVDRAINALLGQLRQGQPTVRWLLVFDNAEDPEKLLPLIPDTGGHVLITSRNRDWIRTWPTLEVGLLQPADGIELLRSQLPGMSEEDASLVAERLGHLALALEQAAAWLKLSNTPVGQYLEMLDTQLADALDLTEAPDYPRTAQATWLLSLRDLRAARPTAAHLLELCACFAAEPIAVSLLSGDRVTSVLAVHDETRHDRTVVPSLIRLIGRYGLAKLDTATNTIQVHRLIQAVILDQLSPADLAVARVQAQQILAAANPGEPDFLVHRDRYRDLWHHVVPAGALESSDPEVRQLVVDLVRALYQRGDHRSSRALAEEAWAVWSVGEHADDVLSLRLRRHLANALRAGGDAYRQARDIDEEVLARSREHPLLGADHVDTLRAANSYAADLRVAGEFELARNLDEDTVRRFTATFGDGDPQTLLAENNLAVSLRLVGDFQRATELDERVGQRYRDTLGPRDPATLRSAGNFGRDLRDIGSFEDSYRTLRETYETQRGVLSDDHPDTLRTGKQLAVTLRELGRFDEAAEVIREACVHYHRAYPPTSLELLSCDMIDASVRSAQGDHTAAASLAEDALRRYQQTLGESHMLTLACRNNLAVFLRRDGRAAAARAMAEPVLAALSADLGPRHPFTLAAQLNLASDLFALGDLGAALRMDERAYSDFVHVLGPGHPDALRAAVNLAHSRAASDDDAGATMLLQPALAALEAIFGTDNARLVSLSRGARFNCYIDPPPN